MGRHIPSGLAAVLSRTLLTLGLAGLVLAKPAAARAAEASAAPPAEAAAGEVSVFSDQVAYAIDAPGLAQQERGYFGGGSLSGLYPTAEPGHLIAVTPPGDALVGRRLDLPLSRLPFLTWSWRRLTPDSGPAETLAGDAPLRLIIGFAGGHPPGPSESPPPQGGVTAHLPPFDRALVITWSNNAWDSGSADRRGVFGRFVAHGGAADGQWWQQTVNLADLYAQLWPDARTAAARVAWVAVAVRQSGGRTIGEIAGIALAP